MTQIQTPPLRLMGLVIACVVGWPGEPAELSSIARGVEPGPSAAPKFDVRGPLEIVYDDGTRVQNDGRYDVRISGNGKNETLDSSGLKRGPIVAILPDGNSPQTFYVVHQQIRDAKRGYLIHHIADGHWRLVHRIDGPIVRPQMHWSDGGRWMVFSRDGWLYGFYRGRLDSVHISGDALAPRDALYRKIEFTDLNNGSTVCSTHFDRRYHKHALFDLLIAGDDGINRVRLNQPFGGPIAELSDGRLRMLTATSVIDVNVDDQTVTSHKIRQPADVGVGGSKLRLIPIKAIAVENDRIVSIWRRPFRSFVRYDVDPVDSQFYHQVFELPGDISDDDSEVNGGSRVALINRVLYGVNPHHVDADGGLWIGCMEGGLLYRRPGSLRANGDPDPPAEYRHLDHRHGLIMTPTRRISSRTGVDGSTDALMVTDTDGMFRTYDVESLHAANPISRWIGPIIEHHDHHYGSAMVPRTVAVLGLRQGDYRVIDQQRFIDVPPFRPDRDDVADDTPPPRYSLAFAMPGPILLTRSDTDRSDYAIARDGRWTPVNLDRLDNIPAASATAETTPSNLLKSLSGGIDDAFAGTHRGGRLGYYQTGVQIVADRQTAVMRRYEQWIVRRDERLQKFEASRRMPHPNLLELGRRFIRLDRNRRRVDVLSMDEWMAASGNEIPDDAVVHLGERYDAFRQSVDDATWPENFKRHYSAPMFVTAINDDSAAPITQYAIKDCGRWVIMGDEPLPIADGFENVAVDQSGNVLLSRYDDGNWTTYVRLNRTPAIEIDAAPTTLDHRDQTIRISVNDPTAVSGGPNPTHVFRYELDAIPLSKWSRDLQNIQLPDLAPGQYRLTIHVRGDRHFVRRHRFDFIITVAYDIMPEIGSIMDDLDADDRVTRHQAADRLAGLDRLTRLTIRDYLVRHRDHIPDSETAKDRLENLGMLPTAFLPLR